MSSHVSKGGGSGSGSGWSGWRLRLSLSVFLHFPFLLRFPILFHPFLLAPLSGSLPPSSMFITFLSCSRLLLSPHFQRGTRHRPRRKPSDFPPLHSTFRALFLTRRRGLRTEADRSEYRGAESRGGKGRKGRRDRSVDSRCVASLCHRIPQKFCRLVSRAWLNSLEEILGIDREARSPDRNLFLKLI